jgi:hypothetical protein
MSREMPHYQEYGEAGLFKEREEWKTTLSQLR